MTKSLPVEIRLQPANIWPILKKEMQSYFNSPIAYVVIVVFLAIVGWFFTSNLFLMNASTLRVVFDVVPLVYLFFIPAISMRLIAEEKKSGTIELLVTKPVLDSEIVLGKFIAAWLLTAAALLPTVLYYVTVAVLGKIDTGQVIGGYLGLLFLAGAWISVGIFASSLTENQVVAFIFALLMVFVFFMLDKVVMYVPGFLSPIFEFLGTSLHYENMARGVIDSRDVIYFLSVTGFFLYLSTLSLERRNN